MVYKKVKLLDIANIERAKNKECQAGVVIVQISATRGQVKYIDEPRIVESKYAILKPCDKINPKYFYYAVENSIDEFLHKYQSDLNIRIEDFKYMELVIESDSNIQEEQVKKIETIDRVILLSEKELGKVKEFKNAMLSEMLI